MSNQVKEGEISLLSLTKVESIARFLPGGGGRSFFYCKGRSEKMQKILSSRRITLNERGI